MPDAIGPGMRLHQRGTYNWGRLFGIREASFYPNSHPVSRAFRNKYLGTSNCHLLWGSWTRVGVGHNPCITCILLPAFSKGVLNG